VARLRSRIVRDLHSIDVGPGSPPAFAVRVQRAAPVQVRIQGELDLATRDVLTAAIGALRRRGDVRVDAAGISFVDCIGLASLVDLARTTRASGARFEMASMSAPLARLAALTGAAAEL
jgi:anti-anti-sigma factor